MSLQNKVIWSEGLFLKPQHFQQQDRYLESLITQRPSILEPYNWGITELNIDTTLLSQGKFTITNCRGILPDGTAFHISHTDNVLLTLNIPENIANQKIYLCLAQQKNRCQTETIEVQDQHADFISTTQIQIGQLALSLKLEQDDRQNDNYLAIAKILESNSNHHVTLDIEFLPACMDIQALPRLRIFLEELESLLKYRGERLAQRLTEAGTGGVAEISDFLLLQIVNRFIPLVTHLLKQRGIHPEYLYRSLLQLAGELATFTQQTHQPIPMPLYQHDALANSFYPLIEELRRSLRVVLEENAIALKLDQQPTGIWVANIADKQLLKTALFVLAVHSSTPQETIRRLFPTQIKIAPVEKIRHLVNRALPGIEIQPLAVAPRQIPFHANFNYFAIHTENPLWSELEKSGGIALHVGGNFPDLKLEFWAVRK